jgi:hypothetical protein
VILTKTEARRYDIFLVFSGRIFIELSASLRINTSVKKARILMPRAWNDSQSSVGFIGIA